MTASTAGSAAKTASSALVFAGIQMSSESRNEMKRPVASATPVFRAAAAP